MFVDNGVKKGGKKGLKKVKKNEYKKVILEFKTNNLFLIVLTLFRERKKREKKDMLEKEKRGLKRWQRIMDIESVEKKTDNWAIGVLEKVFKRNNMSVIAKSQ